VSTRALVVLSSRSVAGLDRAFWDSRNRHERSSQTDLCCSARRAAVAPLTLRPRNARLSSSRAIQIPASASTSAWVATCLHI
jgi:hypothetical protein